MHVTKATAASFCVSNDGDGGVLTASVTQGGILRNLAYLHLCKCDHTGRSQSSIFLRQHPGRKSTTFTVGLACVASKELSPHTHSHSHIKVTTQEREREREQVVPTGRLHSWWFLTTGRAVGSLQDSDPFCLAGVLLACISHHSLSLGFLLVQLDAVAHERCLMRPPT